MKYLISLCMYSFHAQYVRGFQYVRVCMFLSVLVSTCIVWTHQDMRVCLQGRRTSAGPIDFSVVEPLSDKGYVLNSTAVRRMYALCIYVCSHIFSCGEGHVLKSLVAI